MCAACHCGPKYPAAASALSLAVPGGKALGGAGSWREGDGTRGLLATLQTLPAFHSWLSTLSHYSTAERDEMGIYAYSASSSSERQPTKQQWVLEAPVPPHDVKRARLCRLLLLVPLVPP